MPRHFFYLCILTFTLVDILSLISYQKTFNRLNREQACSFVKRLEQKGLPVISSFIQLLRSLILLAIYDDIRV
jgi:hypothetical protein